MEHKQVAPAPSEDPVEPQPALVDAWLPASTGRDILLSDVISRLVLLSAVYAIVIGLALTFVQAAEVAGVTVLAIGVSATIGSAVVRGGLRHDVRNSASTTQRPAAR
jgi:hypothetical protein